MHPLCGSTVIAGMIMLSTLSAPAAEPLRDRREFAAAISKVEEGMSADDALRLVGKPDDVMTRDDIGWNGSFTTVEIWRYGTAGHLKPATLGEIFISERRLVQTIIGKGKPGSTGGLSEAQLRLFLEAIAEADTFTRGDWFNPRPLIRAVNLLQPVGKEAALAAIEEFLRITPSTTPKKLDSNGNGAIVVMRMLFDVPTEQTVFPGGEIGKPGCMPPMSDFGKPHNTGMWPRFPIAVEGDIPFFVAGQMTIERISSELDDSMSEAEQHLAYFRKGGKMRKQKLNPSHKPFAALDSFLKSPRRNRNLDARELDLAQRRLQDQSIRLLDSVFRSYTEFGSLAYSGNPRGLKIRWDETHNNYTFLDGSTLPAPVRYRRHGWRPFPKGKFEFVLERDSPTHISAGVFSAGRTDAPATLRLFNVKSRDQDILRFEGFGGSSLSRSIGQGTDLNDGVEVQAELTVGDKQQFSPIFKP